MRMPWSGRHQSADQLPQSVDGDEAPLVAGDLAVDEVSRASPDAVSAPEPEPGVQAFTKGTDDPVPRADRVSANETDTRVLLRVAEEAWRLGRRLDRAASDVGDAPLTDIRDALQRLRDILSEAGIEAVDHDGDRYVDGLRLHILHVEGEAADGVPLCIVRTVRPSILAQGQVAVSGQVILGPADQETTIP